MTKTPPTTTKRLILLGSTGSIGRQTVEVVRHLNALADRGEHPTRYEIVGLAGGRNADALLAQAMSLDVRDVAVADAGAIDERTAGGRGLRVRTGRGSAERLVREVECDLVLAAIVGFKGLDATLAAVELGRDVALANKETLVAAGDLVVARAKRTGAALLPVDSEHSAIWQCVAGRGDERVRTPCTLGPEVARVILTASGGALRDKPLQEVRSATPADALAHPTWSMGAKVTIDCASLTNKALEVIEAHWLFGLERARIGVLVHPQSIVHSFVEYADGSAIAQLGAPDMRTPIQLTLTWPRRAPGCSDKLDWGSMSRLDFEEPDLERFPALGLGFGVVSEGGTSGAVFNGANEAAVEAFLAGRILFGRIGELVGRAMEEIGVSPVRDLADVVEADAEARRFVEADLSGSGSAEVRAEAGVRR